MAGAALGPLHGVPVTIKARTCMNSRVIPSNKVRDPRPVRSVTRIARGRPPEGGRRRHSRQNHHIRGGYCNNSGGHQPPLPMVARFCFNNRKPGGADPAPWSASHQAASSIWAAPPCGVSSASQFTIDTTFPGPAAWLGRRQGVSRPSRRDRTDRGSLVKHWSNPRQLGGLWSQRLNRCSQTNQ